MPGAEGDLIAIRMRLLGGKEAAAEAEAATAAIKETGVAAKETSAQSAAASKKAASESAIASKAIKRQGQVMREVGMGMTKWITAPLLAIGGASIYMASNFKRQMGLVATDAGGSAKEVKRLEGSVLEMSHRTQFGPQKLAESLFHVESSGYRGAKAMKVLNESQKLATTGNSDLQATTYALVSATKALYGESLTNVNKTAAELNGIVAHGDMRLEELTSAMSTGVIPKAKAMGLSLRDIGAAMDVMTSRGIPAQRAAYALGFTMQKLIPYGEKAEDAFKSIGLGQETLLKRSQGGKYGYVSGLELLQKHLDKLPTKGQQTKVIEEMFGGGRMTSGLLTDLQNLGEMKKIYGELGDEVQKYNHHVKEAEEQPLVKMKRAWSSIEASLVQIGGVLLPIAVPLLEKTAHFVSSIGEDFATLPAPAQKFLLITAGIAALAGPMLMLAGGLAKAAVNLGEFMGVEAAATGSRGMAGMLAGGLVKAIPFAFAAAGVGNVAAKAVGGETKQALQSGVGMAVGGALGAALGSVIPGAGTVTGGMVGAGLGSFLGPSIASLFSAGPKISLLRRELNHAADAAGNFKKSIAGLPAAEHAVTRATDRHRKAVHLERAAQRNLAHALGEFGVETIPATRAQLKLDNAQRRVVRSARAERNAHRLAGNALKLFREDSLAQVASIKQAMPLMHRRIRAMNREITEGKGGHQLLVETVHLEERARGAKHELTEAYAQAESKAGKPWAHRLQSLSALQAKYGRSGHVLTQRLAEQRSQLHELTETGYKQTPMWESIKTAIGETLSELESFTAATEGLAPKHFNPSAAAGHNHPTAPPRTFPGHHRKTSAAGRAGTSTASTSTAGPAAFYLRRPKPPGSGASAPLMRPSGGGRPLRVEVPVYLDRRQIAYADAKTVQDDEARL